MPDDDQKRVFGDVQAAAEGFENLPFMAAVTEGPELRTAAFNALARAMMSDRMAYGQPILESFPFELMGQGWPAAYRLPTETGETVTMHESRIQLQEPDGSVLEIYIDATFSPLPGPDGRSRGTIVTCQDVTQRVQDRAVADRELAQLRQRYAEARGSVQAMQRALLADSVPVLPSFDVAARYVLASAEEAAGGDWFDAVPREDGSLLLVVGDVVGHGQGAAVAMGQLRSVLLAQLRAGAGVVAALEFLDGFAAGIPAARRATVCVARLEESGAVEYCTAGHPPPLLLGPGEDATRYLSPSGAGPLATGSEFSTATARLDVGEAIVLYSDGILERPGTVPAVAAMELRNTARDAQRNVIMPAGAPESAAERICALTIELLTRMRGHADDITMLAAQRQPPARRLDLELEPGPDAVAIARSALRAWLRELGPGPDDVDNLLHAVTELVANVVDHAHLEAPARPFRLRARLGRDGDIVLDVVDGGAWKPPLITEQRGRGLAMVRQLVDSLVIERTPKGTTATVRHGARRRAGLLAGAGSPDVPDPEYFDVWSAGGPEPTVTFVGPLDATNAPEATTYLELALAEAGAAVTVDLGQVTVLASTGVDLLFRVAERAHSQGLQMKLVAPNGSPAQQIMSLVRLPYQPTR